MSATFMTFSSARSIQPPVRIAYSDIMADARGSLLSHRCNRRAAQKSSSGAMRPDRRAGIFP
jgi:hypothetical protein